MFHLHLSRCNGVGAPHSTQNEYLVLALREETAVQAVVGSIAWAFRRVKKPSSREMSARGYALHSVRPPTFLFRLVVMDFCREATGV